ncbi:MAG: hypothetical protein AB4290_00930 [Spirulina sp.]
MARVFARFAFTYHLGLLYQNFKTRDIQGNFAGNVDGNFEARASELSIDNTEQQIGEQHNYASDPRLQKAIDEIAQILKKLQKDYPTATESEEVRDIIEVEFEEIQTSKKKKWEMITRYLLERERWMNGGKAAVLAALDSAKETSFGKVGIAFLESFIEEE